MDVGLELLKPLLVDDAEALFFIDDDEAELFELDRFGDHRMGAHDDVDRAVGKAVASLLRLGGGNEAGQAADVDGEAFEAFDEIGEMLAREPRGRTYKSDLQPPPLADAGCAGGDPGISTEESWLGKRSVRE